MATQQTTVNIIDSCRVALPPDSVTESSLRLTFFDIMWLQLPPVQRLFFFKLPPTTATTSHFQTSLLPHLKFSLSQALHLFYPLSGKLTYPPDSTHHEILTKPNDSVSLTIAESDSDFFHLSGNHPRPASDLHPLVPHLPPTDPLPAPVLALQVTHFPNVGICIGISLHHVAADGWCSTHFMKSWASIFKAGSVAVTSLPVYDRTETVKFDSITRNHFLKMEKVKNAREGIGVNAREQLERATFLLTRAQIEGLKQLVLASDANAHVSTFVLTCSYVWATLIKARDDGDDGSKMARFLFAVDVRSRLVPPIPVTYFGNCIGGCFAEAKRGDLRGEGGVVAAAAAIGRAVRGLEAGEGVMRGAESWLRRVAELGSEGLVSVAGSPRFRVYETDFGWGKAEKVEVISIEGTGAISLAESRREEEGGVEVGLALSKCELNAFASLFEEGLKVLAL